MIGQLQLLAPLIRAGVRLNDCLLGGAPVFVLQESRYLSADVAVPLKAGVKASDIAIAAREILRWRKTLNEAIARHTGKSAEQIEKDSDRDYYLSAPEAKEYGIVDHVVSSTREAQTVVQAA